MVRESSGIVELKQWKQKLLKSWAKIVCCVPSFPSKLPSTAAGFSKGPNSTCICCAGTPRLLREKGEDTKPFPHRQHLCKLPLKVLPPPQLCQAPSPCSVAQCIGSNRPGMLYEDSLNILFLTPASNAVYFGRESAFPIEQNSGLDRKPSGNCNQGDNASNSRLRETKSLLMLSHTPAATALDYCWLPLDLKLRRQNEARSEGAARKFGRRKSPQSTDTLIFCCPSGTVLAVEVET